MITLSKETIQRLAVLRAVSLWEKGAQGPARLHKTLFFADHDSADQKRRLFTFKRWCLGQYSDEVANALNSLQDAGRIRVHFDGPAGRIDITLSTRSSDRLRRFFRRFFPEWEKSLARAFRRWAHLNEDQILVEAQDDPAYRQFRHGEIIAASSLPKHVELSELDDQEAEFLADLVDSRLAGTLKTRLRTAAKTHARREDWKSIYFTDEPAAV